MALKEELENSGNWLFRWRSYLPLIMIGIFLAALKDYEYPANSERLDHLLEVFCLSVSFFGLGIRAFTVGHTPKGTSGRNTKHQIAETLNTTGAYSVVRNPLYLGNFFMGLGVALFHRLWWLTLIYILSFWIYYERIIFAEEAYLRDKFGDKYMDWAKRTPVIVPNFRLYKKSDLIFSVKNVLKREYNGFFAVVFVLFIFETIGDLIVMNKLEIDLMWAIILCTSFIIYITLRTLKKHTFILNEEGR